MAAAKNQLKCGAVWVHGAQPAIRGSLSRRRRRRELHILLTTFSML